MTEFFNPLTKEGITQKLMVYPGGHAYLYPDKTKTDHIEADLSLEPLEQGLRAFWDDQRKHLVEWDKFWNA